MNAWTFPMSYLPSSTFPMTPTSSYRYRSSIRYQSPSREDLLPCRQTAHCTLREVACISIGKHLCVYARVNDLPPTAVRRSASLPPDRSLLPAHCHLQTFPEAQGNIFLIQFPSVDRGRMIYQRDGKGQVSSENHYTTTVIVEGGSKP